VASLRSLHPRVYPLARAFVDALEHAGVHVTVTSTVRGPDVQAELYANFVAGRSKFPAAPPGRSTHALGIAFDVHLDPPVYDQAGAVWESLGFTWGGRFGDPIHFDFRPRAGS